MLWYRRGQSEAWNSFNVLLEAMYVEYLEGKRVGTYQRKTAIRRGRPSKGGVKINTLVRESTKQIISKLATKFGCSYGEAIDYLSGYFVATPKVEECGEEYKTKAKTPRTSRSKRSASERRRS